MFGVIYRWRIKQQFERQFIESWSVITKYYVENLGGLGSRLHRGNDDIWYAYAQWESDDARQKAFEEFPDLPERGKMREAIAETFPEIPLEVKADFLVLPERK